MITLAIDASTYVGSVAVLKDDVVLAEECTAMKDATHERLMPAVAAVIQRATLTVRGIDRVVCGAGPGSFTSLRIAASIAKAIATGTNKPLYAVSSLALLAGGTEVGRGRYLVALDALRGEFYVGLFDVGADGSVSEIEPARLVAADGVEPLAAELSARIASPSAFPNGIVASPRASAVRHSAWTLTEPVDIGSWEPAYGRLAEAQVKWEHAHGRPLSTG
jgi:tRNA threonylcarbamoyladenosine biosynthesis protein TsaB